MIKENILQADLLDILFDNRNKNYGAYPLRKYYHERVYKALGIIFFFVVSLSAYVLLTNEKLSFAKSIVIPDNDMGSIPPVIEDKQIIPPPTPSQPVPRNVSNQQTYNSIKMVDSTETVSKPPNPDSASVSSAPDHNGTPGNTKVGEGPGSGGNTTSITNTSTNSVKPIDRTIVQYSAEVMPSYPGGLSALTKIPAEESGESCKTWMLKKWYQ